MIILCSYLIYIFYKRGHSLTGKTAILHIVISGSSPDVSNLYLTLAREAQPGRAELWRCLGCKFKSYLEQTSFFYTYSWNRCVGIGRQVPLRMEWF